MARGIKQLELESEWDRLPKDWYSIYQWKRTTGEGYAEWIAQRISASLPQITLNRMGLRARSFRIPEHRGQIKLSTSIEQLTEKRLVRAMFNASPLLTLGNVLDYEVPLKDTDDAHHGDIDLLCVTNEVVFCIEAKQPKSSESLLKSVLQAYAYTSLVTTTKDLFMSSFALDPRLPLTPAVLTFSSARSGRQLNHIAKFPQLVGLIRTLNLKLTEDRNAPMRFFVVENAESELRTCLTTKQETNGDVKAVFCEGFALSIVEKVVE